jgi:hypothetical protein
MNSVLCIVAGCFQEAMIRRIKKKFGLISLILFMSAIPLTFFNIIFSDPAPYFTLCTFGCFSVEECTTKDQDWGNYTSLSFVFALAFLLSAEVLALRFNLIFIMFTTPEVKIMVQEVNQKYNKGKDKGNIKDAEGSDADETKYPNVVTKSRVDDGQIEMHSDPENEKKLDLVEVLEDNMLRQTRLKSEFVNVSRTHKPIQYLGE